MNTYQFNPNLKNNYPQIAIATEGCLIKNNKEYNHLQPDQVEQIAKLHNQSYETIEEQLENIEDEDKNENLQDELIEDLENNLSGHYILQLAHYAGLTIETN